MEKLHQQMGALYCEQKQAQRSATNSLRRGEIDSALRAQHEALRLEARLAETRLQLFQLNAREAARYAEAATTALSAVAA
jgi:hypothetical protein